MADSTDTYLEDVPSVPPQFDFDLIGAAFAKVLDQPAEGATVIGIHGPWGSGKTTLMYAIRDQLQAESTGPEPIVIEFNAWKYQAREALWRALILRLVAELGERAGGSEKSAKLEQLETSLYQAFEVQEVGPWSINWRGAATEVAAVALEVLQLGVAGRLLRRVFGRKAAEGGPGLGADDIERINGALERQTVNRRLAQVQSIEQFLGAFRELVEELRGNDQRLVVLVDDLDRCLPESALEVFEAIKLFLDAPGCDFVVAVDREVIRNGLAVRYGETSGSVADADEYIEKTIAISYDVPRLSAPDVELLIDGAGLPLALGDVHKTLIRKALGRNPRRVKRFLNLLQLQLDLAARAAAQGHSVPGSLSGGKDDDPEALTVLLKTMLIGYRFPFLVRRGEDLTLLFALQRAVVEYASSVEADPEKAAADRAAAFAGQTEAVARLRDDRGFWELMQHGPPLHREPERSDVIASVNWFRRTGVGLAAEPEPPQAK